MPLSSLSKPSAQSEISTERPLVEPVRQYLQSLRDHRPPATRDEAVIHVSSVVSGAAIFYERLRYSVDYREEHLLRRHALERILRRRFELSHTVEGMAQPFLVELIHAQYLKNDAVPESAVPTVQAILNRYAMALRSVEHSSYQNRDELKDWFLGLASAELEDLLVPAPEEAALVELMTSSVTRDNPLMAWQLPPEFVQTLTFVAAHRALYAFDPPTIHHLLLRRSYPAWESTPATDVRTIIPTLLEHRANMLAALKHPAGEKLWRALKSRAIVFHALGDVVKKHHGNPDVLANEADVAQEVGQVCDGYYKAARRRLYASALRATFYILFTKVVIALVVEAPLEKLLYEEVRLLPLAINLVFPAALMITLAMATRLPGVSNTKQVIEFLKTILYGSDRRVFPELKVPRQNRSMSLSFVYAMTFLITFGLVVMGLLRLGFTAVSAGLFLFFLSVVSFFALRIRQPIRDLFVIRQRDTLFTLLIDFFSLPVLKVGQWISVTSSRFNVFLFLFDYFLEAPFKAFLLLTEDVLGFFREKREDIL